MDLKQLKYFAAVMEEGNISAAAQKLNISQPPLSTQIKNLEDELETVLFERTPRQCVPTDAGLLLYKKAKNILYLANSAVQEIENFNKGIKATLRMGTISSSGTVLLTGMLQQYHKNHPNVCFEIQEGNTFHLIELLSENIIELGIVRTPFKTENLSCLYLKSEPMVAVANKEYFEGIFEKEISVKSLSDKPIILYQRFSSLITEVFEDCKAKPIIFCKNEDARTTLLWAKAGMGIAIVPKSSAKMIWDRNLMEKDLTDKKLYTKIAAVHRKNALLSAAAQNFLEIFKKQV